jgi:hypothetical protein
LNDSTRSQSAGDLRVIIDRLDAQISTLLAERERHVLLLADTAQAATLAPTDPHVSAMDVDDAPAPLTFLQLSDEWNAAGNAPNPTFALDGADLLLKFNVNALQFPDFDEDEIAVLRFVNCARYRLGPTNDEGWYRGQCRFSQLAPAWGEFYLIRGKSNLLNAPSDWTVVEPSGDGRHFLFYFRDNTFECVAARCVIEQVAENSLVRTGRKLPLFATSGEQG